MIPNIGHLLKGRLKVKGLMKLFAEYTLKSAKGNPHRYDYSEMTIDAAMQNDKPIFIVTKDSRQGREKLSTSEISEVLNAMKGYAPSKDDWELVAKV